MEVVVKLNGAQEDAVDTLVSLGYFQTRAEVIRAGVLSIAEKYNALKTPNQVLDELAAEKMELISKEIDEGKRKTITFDELLKEEGLTRDQLDAL